MVPVAVPNNGPAVLAADLEGVALRQQGAEVAGVEAARRDRGQLDDLALAFDCRQF